MVSFYRTKYAIISKGRFGVYDGMFEGKHVIKESIDCWPFPKHHLLDDSQFRLLKGYGKEDLIPEMQEEALL